MLVNIDVADLTVATRFYVDACGLSVGRRFGADAVELVGSDAPIYLLVKASGTNPIPDHNAAAQRSYDRHWTPVHLDFVVDDLVAARDRAVACGATLERDIEDHAWGRIAYLADPFGHGFCLLQLSARGYDAIAT
jgi:catechol 2,3-dioxygenase-like lactoylglutathione lyase family enzyme